MAGRWVLAVAAGLSLGVPAARAMGAAPAAAAEVPVTIPRSHQIDFTSRVTGRPYRLMVYVPEQPAPPTGYPVIYVLDGNLYFATVVESMRLQGRHFIRPSIVVGIGYQTEDSGEALTLRSRDLTLPMSPAKLGPGLRVEAGAAPDFGGLDDFLAMIGREVKPRVADIAPVDRGAQVLFGHSLGGLAVLRQFLRDPGAYAGYVASSPSIWFDDRAVLRDEPGLPARLAALKARPTLLLDVGGLEDQVPRVAALAGIPRAKLEAEARRMAMIGNVRSLGARLARLPGVAVTTVVFAGENHASVVPAAIARGLEVTLPR